MNGPPVDNGNGNVQRWRLAQLEKYQEADTERWTNLTETLIGLRADMAATRQEVAIQKVKIGLLGLTGGAVASLPSALFLFLR